MIKLGDYSYCGLVHDDYDGEIEIGKFSSIANGTVFLGHCEHPPRENRLVVSTYNFAERLNFDYPKCSGRKIKIGNDVWIGENCIIVDGSEIGDGCIIGAGSVVRGKIEPYSIVMGNPGAIVGSRFLDKGNRFTMTEVMRRGEVVKKLLEIKWWDWPIEKIKEAIPDMSDIYSFVEKYGKLQ